MWDYIPVFKAKGSVAGFAIVDSGSAHKVSGRTWFLTRDGYAKANTTIDKKRVTLYLHRVLLDLEPGNPLEADHIHQEPLLNTGLNLRAVLHADNLRNRRKLDSWLRDRGQSRIDGVWEPGLAPWRGA